jgi:transcriptional antiterminator RfaH
MHWYVIRTKPHQERRAEFHLRQLCVETFLPLLKQHKKIRRVNKMVVEPLFPSYLFAKFDISDRYRTVNFTRGVMKIVEFDMRPAQVSESLIQAIRARLEDEYVTRKAERFQKGQNVQIMDGPLAGLEAVFIREMTEQHRVLLLLNTIQLHAKLTVDIDQISPAQGVITPLASCAV